jgi:acetylornithine deacetylase
VKSEKLLRHLKALVAFDTQNPPRKLNSESLLFEYLRTALGTGFDIEITDHGQGRVSFLAVRGQPYILFNVHLDTVPVLDGAMFPPLEMTIHEDRAYGRGVCDIKSAAACLLTIAQRSDAPLALLFTTDEEGAEGVCVDKFIAAGKSVPFGQVIVAEPTRCMVEVVHRGYLSVKGVFRGKSGHSSERRSLRENAIHRMARWSADAVREAKLAEDDGLRSCFNIGTVKGGVKSNVIADRAAIHWSARLLPGQSNKKFLARMMKLDAAEYAEWDVPFRGPPLPNRENLELAADSFARTQGLDVGNGLDFWTEASLFSAAGVPAFVFGPGSIEQAHVVDEWVSLEQLENALGIYQKLVNSHA